MSGKPPTPPTKLENETITVWSYKAKYKTAAVRNSDDEKSIEQSFICVKPDGEIVKSSKYSNTDQSFTGVIEDIWKGEQVVKETKIEDGDVTKEAVLKALHEKQDGTESDESYEKSFSSHHTDSSGELVDIPASDDRCEDKSDERSTSSKQSSSSFKNFECEDEIVVVPERIESEKELIHHSEIKNETQPPMTKSSDSLKEKLLDEGIVSVSDSERKLQKVNSKSRQLVQVIAPLSLGEGYAFEVQSKDKVFIVEVPEGGIEEGDSFYVPLPDDTFGQKLPSKAPIGQWKDGLFDCLKHGGLHASFLSALCCTQVLMAQIMTRMQLNWFGHQTSISETTNTFRYVIILIIAYYTLYYIYGKEVKVFSSFYTFNFLIFVLLCKYYCTLDGIFMMKMV
uniref:Uncharacterized protein n=1 Tax=Corethron hystrix TaxID=216773 RepID=A0A6U5M4F1_9STRA|mmetsp:Transcript_8433/g.18505  ORF Transcript_8433/g.18505 Transcript_8433/m.18505 type:complete len:396 (+) Transcript_8433:269-1456(+)